MSEVPKDDGNLSSRPATSFSPSTSVTTKVNVLAMPADRHMNRNC